MSGTDWKDLEAAWQSLPDDSVPALARKELRRAARLRWWSKTYFVIEILSTVFAWCAGALLVAYGDGVRPIFGIGFVFLATFAMAASLWARARPQPRDEDPILHAVARAADRVNFGIRMAYANLWAIFAALVFLVLYTVSIEFFGLEDDRAAGFLGLALSLGWTSLWLAGTLIYMHWRSRDLERLKALEASLREE